MRVLGIFSGNHSDGMTGYFDYGHNEDLRLLEMTSPASNKLWNNANQVIEAATEEITTTLTKKAVDEAPYCPPAFS